MRGPFHPAGPYDAPTIGAVPTAIPTPIPTPLATSIPTPIQNVPNQPSFPSNFANPNPSYPPRRRFGGGGYGGPDGDRRSGGRERPTRTLFVRNINYDIKEDDLRSEFGKFGEIKKIFNLIEKRGMAFVTYFDLRHADLAKRELQGTKLGDREIDVHYSIPKEDEKPKDDDEKNKGTLFVTVKNPTEEIDNLLMKKVFEDWGAIKEVRDCTGSPTQKFVECWDLRDSAKIVKEKQDYPFAGGTLDVKFAYNSAPRERRSYDDRRGGPIRSSYQQRQSQNFAQSNMPGSPQPPMLDMGFVNQLASLIAAQPPQPPQPTQHPPAQSTPNPYQQMVPQQTPPVQQLAYLLSFAQQQMGNPQNPQRPPVPGAVPPQMQMVPPQMQMRPAGAGGPGRGGGGN